MGTPKEKILFAGKPGSDSETREKFALLLNVLRAEAFKCFTPPLHMTDKQHPIDEALGDVLLYSDKLAKAMDTYYKEVDKK